MEYQVGDVLQRPSGGIKIKVLAVEGQTSGPFLGSDYLLGPGWVVSQTFSDTYEGDPLLNEIKYLHNLGYRKV
jgi:hypothetical protein